jgi:hypothetical protein
MRYKYLNKSSASNSASTYLGRLNNIPSLGLFSLLAANILTIIFFISSNGSIIQALWIYWLQSVIIGIINVYRILTSPLKGRVDINGQQMPASQLKGKRITAGKREIASFFVMHYGLFHLVYAVFLWAFSTSNFVIDVNNKLQVLDLGTFSVVAILLNGVIFAFHHIFSFISERQYFKAHVNELPDTDKILLRPYARILPMQLIIILGPLLATITSTNKIFLLFMILKTIADLLFYRRSMVSV